MKQAMILILGAVLAGGAVQAQILAELKSFRDSESGFTISHPVHWRLEQPGGPTRLLIGVPMGAVEWERSDTREGKPVFARGIKVYRMTAAALWSAECAAIGHSKPVAEAHFALRLDLIGDIIGSARFPRGSR